MLAHRILALAARFLLVLGCACMLLGGYLLWQSRTFAADTEKSTGTVVSYREVADGDKKRQRPRIRFKTESGDIITFEGQLATETQRYAIDSTVPVSYARFKPTDARIATFVDNLLGPTAAGVIGVLSFSAGFLIRRGARRAAGAPAR